MKMTPKTRALDKIYKRRDRYEIPDWQREEVWSPQKKQLLIDSILRGWKLPKFYFLKTGSEPEEYEVVDGQQRLMSIFDFFDNELALSKSSSEKFGGKRYRDLPDTRSDEFDDFEIEFDVIEDSSEKEVKEFFQRLQQGLPLTSSERLNSVHSKLRDFCRDVAKHPFFENKVVVRDRRYAHFDIVSKVAAIEIDGSDVGFRYDDLKAVFESQSNFSPNSNVAKRIENTFKFLDVAFTNREPLLRNRSLVQSFSTLSASIVKGRKEKGYEAQFRAFFAHFMRELAHQVELGQEATDSDYLRFQRTVNANVREGARIRQGVLMKKLLAFDPSAVDLFSADSIASSGLEDQISTSAEQITDLVHRINGAYASSHGKDLFKPTNETARAQLVIGKRIEDVGAYQSFIKSLWFLIWESPGSRLKDQEPESFKDVNDLRTALSHDVDHGKDARTRSRRKKLGATFEKYAGAGTPETVGPERFLVVQSALLSAIEKDLRVLLHRISDL